ncbi:MAG: LysR family transcriptional regulator [Sphingomonas bacterium]|jgi:DNA-binding transcriptional LysR family regulator|nr:LysR family transcriptional regulator [Sphingomonas bacterium]
MELRHLRYFVKVGDELHFGRAAELLGISQPPLSQQIRQLEEELGVVLFERTSRRVTLTVAGRLFLVEAKATLAQADHAVSTVRRAAIGEVGELSFGLSASALFVPAMSAAIAEFSRSHPDVHLELAEMSTPVQRDAMLAGTLDIGLVRSARRPPMPEGIIVSELEVDRMCVAFSADHRLAADEGPISVADIVGEAMVHYPYDREGFTEDINRLFETVGAKPRIVQVIREMSTLLSLVAAGVGITILPGPLQRLRVDNVRYREFSDSSALSTMWLLHTRARPTCLAFLAVLERHRAADAA